MPASEVQDLDLLTDNLWDEWAVPYRIKVAMESRRSEDATETVKRDFSGMLFDSVSDGLLGSWLPEVPTAPGAHAKRALEFFSFHAREFCRRKLGTSGVLLISKP